MPLSTPQDFCATPCNSAGESLPAPGSSRSITNFGMSSSAKDGEITSLAAGGSTLGWGSKLEGSGRGLLKFGVGNRTVFAHTRENLITRQHGGLRMAPWIVAHIAEPRRDVGGFGQGQRRQLLAEVSRRRHPDAAPSERERSTFRH